MARKPEKPFDKIITVRSRLDMYVQYGDVALQGQSPQDFAAEVKEVVDLLMAFRNIVNGMVSFDQHPEDAALFYISADRIGGGQ